MRKVKFFKSVTTEIEALEADLNRWLESSGVELISVSGNLASSSSKSELESFSAADVLVVVVYETEPKSK